MPTERQKQMIKKYQHIPGLCFDSESFTTETNYLRWILCAPRAGTTGPGCPTRNGHSTVPAAWGCSVGERAELTGTRYWSGLGDRAEPGRQSRPLTRESVHTHHSTPSPFFLRQQPESRHVGSLKQSKFSFQQSSLLPHVWEISSKRECF